MFGLDYKYNGRVKCNRVKIVGLEKEIMYCCVSMLDIIIVIVNSEVRDNQSNSGRKTRSSMLFDKANEWNWSANE